MSVFKPGTKASNALAPTTVLPATIAFESSQLVSQASTMNATGAGVFEFALAVHFTFKDLTPVSEIKAVTAVVPAVATGTGVRAAFLIRPVDESDPPPHDAMTAVSTTALKNVLNFIFDTASEK